MPNIARGWELSDGGRTTTIFLRRGMKWSDGHPFTADDFLFWYEDMYKNKELIPTPSLFLSINGKPGEVEKVDTYTVGSDSPILTRFSLRCWPAPRQLGWPFAAWQGGHGRLCPGPLSETVPPQIYV